MTEFNTFYHFVLSKEEHKTVNVDYNSLINILQELYYATNISSTYSSYFDPLGYSSGDLTMSQVQSMIKQMRQDNEYMRNYINQFAYDFKEILERAAINGGVST